MRENDGRIRLCLNAVSGEKWFREGKNALEMRAVARWTQVPNQIDSKALHLVLPNYDIATETIRIETFVQKARATKGIALT